MVSRKKLSHNDFSEQRLHPLHAGIENISLRMLPSDLALKNGLELAPLEQILIKYWLGILMFIDTMSVGRKIEN